MKLHYYCNAKKGICTKSNCNNCKKFDKTGGKYIEVDENRNPTNFEIIAQNEEALAEFLATYGIACCTGKEKCDTTTNCKECIKEWLQREVTGE